MKRGRAVPNKYMRSTFGKREYTMGRYIRTIRMLISVTNSSESAEFESRNQKVFKTGKFGPFGVKKNSSMLDCFGRVEGGSLRVVKEVLLL